MPVTPTRLLLALPLSVAVVLGASTPAWAQPQAHGERAGAARFGPAIEDVPHYQPQQWCWPSVKPGTRRLANHLKARYPGTLSDGISRACTRGGPSEHKEGRAFDWGVSIRNATQQRQAWNFLTWLLAPDRYGHRRAMARRMGIMYVIWSGHIFNADGPPRRYSGASSHGDHMHISQSWAGAMGRTSFWSGRVTSASWTPSPPVPAATREVFGLPSGTRRGVSTRAPLRAGGLYRIVVSGVYYSGKGMADADCTRDPATGIWRAFDPRHPRYELLDLHINGANARLKAIGGTGCAVRTHTYTTQIRAKKTRRAYFSIRDPRPGDNVGQLVVRVVRIG